MKSVKAYDLRGDTWVSTHGDASSILSPAGLLLEVKNRRQSVDFFPVKPMALSSFSVEGSVDVVMKFLCRKDGVELVIRKKAGDLMHHSTKWDKIIMEIPLLHEDAVNIFRVSFQAKDEVSMVSFCELFETQEKKLVLNCADNKKVMMNFHAAVGSSKLVRMKFEQSAFLEENESLDLLDFDSKTVENVKMIMTSRTISFSQVTAECIALMDYLMVDDMKSVWKLARRFLNKDNCLEFMRLAHRHGDAKTIHSGLKFANDADMEQEALLEAVSIMQANLSHFKVVDAIALCDALKAK